MAVISDTINVVSATARARCSGSAPPADWSLKCPANMSIAVLNETVIERVKALR